ncbi:MAG: hypothetical protein AAGA48_30505 [Myxococcota bacterium]
MVRWGKCSICGANIVAHGARGPIPNRCEDCRKAIRRRRAARVRQGERVVNQRLHRQLADESLAVRFRPLLLAFQWSVSQGQTEEAPTLAELLDQHDPDFLQSALVAVSVAHHSAPRGEKCKAGWAAWLAFQSATLRAVGKGQTVDGEGELFEG